MGELWTKLMACQASLLGLWDRSPPSQHSRNMPAKIGGHHHNLRTHQIARDMNGSPWWLAPQIEPRTEPTGCLAVRPQSGPDARRRQTRGADRLSAGLRLDPPTPS